MKRTEDYERPSVAADAVVFGIDTAQAESRGGLKQRRLKLLLVRRGEEPFAGYPALPGGFLRRGETLEQAAQRELAEEAGVCNPKLMQLGTFSSPSRDPRGWVLSCAFLALTRTVTLSTAAGSDAAEACWMQVSCTDTPQGESLCITDDAGKILLQAENGSIINHSLAFDHAEIILAGFRRLRDEVLYHDLIFDLMPELFAVSDLQQPYEIITGTHTSPQNFRKKMASKLIETEYYNETAAHRTAKLYRRKDGIT